MKLSYDIEHTIAILIGAGQYNTEDFPAIPPVKGNLEDLRKLLLDKDVFGLSDHRIVVLEDKNNIEILEVLTETLSDEKLKTVFIYYSGHGHRTAKDELYLTAYNSKKAFNLIKKTGIEFSDIKIAIENSPSKPNSVIIIDACYSGIIAGQSDELLTDDEKTIKGSYIITSSNKKDQSFFDPKGRHTFFTEELINILSNGSENNDMLLTLNDLFSNLQKRMRKQKAEPQRNDRFDKEVFYFAKNIKFNEEFILKNAEEYFQKGNFFRALEYYNTLKEKFNIASYLDQIEKCQNEINYINLIDDGDVLLNNKKFEQALIKFNEAKKIKSESLLIRKIRDCEYEIKLETEVLKRIEEKRLLDQELQRLEKEKAELERKEAEELRQKQEEELKQKQEEELKKKQEDELKRKQEDELKQKQAEELKKKQEDELKRKQEEELKQKQAEELKRKHKEDLKRKHEKELKRVTDFETKKNQEEKIIEGKLSFDIENTLAILIGTGMYATDDFIPIEPIEGNLEDLRNILLDKSIVGLKESNIYVIENKSSTEILRKIKEVLFVNNLKTVLIYYSGHGYRTSKDRLFLTAANSEKDFDVIEMTGVEFSKLKNIIENSPSKPNSIFIIDACLSGIALQNGDALTEDERNINRGCILASFSIKEQSFFYPNGKHTYFTGELLDILDKGMHVSKSVMSISDIFINLQKRVRGKYGMEPLLSDNMDVPTFNFAKNKYIKPDKERSKTNQKNQQRNREEVVNKKKQIVPTQKKNNNFQGSRLIPEKRLLEIFLKFKKTISSLYVHPNIPINKLNNARVSCRIPDDEQLIAMIDLTIFGSGKECLAFTTLKMYNRQLWDSPNTIAYSDFPKENIIHKSGYIISFDERKINLGGIGSDSETTNIVALLNKIKNELK